MKSRRERRYSFRITISGIGKNVNDAWQDAYEAFMLDPGDIPEKKDIKVEEIDT